MAAYGYLTLLLCFTSNVWAQRLPTISHITQNQIRDVGSQVDLDCSVRYGQDYPVLWVKYDRQKTTEGLPLSTNTGLITRDPRLSLRFDEATETYTLSIRNLQETDSGWYQCQVLTSVSNKITAEVELQVRRPASSTRSPAASEGESTPAITHITEKQIRDVGSQVDLDCTVHLGQEYPVLWVMYDRENTTEVLPLSTNSALIIRDSRFSLRLNQAAETYTLSIRDLQEVDSGRYQCQVIMSVSNKITAEVELQVRRPPIISDSSTRSPAASEGETSTFGSRPQNQSDDKRKPPDDISHPQNQSDCDLSSEASVDQVLAEGSRLCTEKLLVKAALRSALAAERQAAAAQQAVGLLRDLLAALRGPPAPAERRGQQG